MTKKLAREQLDAVLKAFSPLKSTPVPVKGWIKAIRETLGMSAIQLAKRTRMTRQAVHDIEKREMSDTITFKTIQNVAEGLDCVFVYALVPKISLEQSVREQARKKAIKRLNRVQRTMSLEDQALSLPEKEKALKDAVDELVVTGSRALWDE